MAANRLGWTSENNMICLFLLSKEIYILYGVSYQPTNLEIKGVSFIIIVFFFFLKLKKKKRAVIHFFFYTWVLILKGN